jgi:hypothetical protein
MSSGRGKRAKRRAEPVPVPAVDRTPPWSVIYYRAGDGTVPALEFLDGCPGKLEGEFSAVLDAVAAAPPPQFSGGGKWEAMHGAMTGYHEIRLTGEEQGCAPRRKPCSLVDARLLQFADWSSQRPLCASSCCSSLCRAGSGVRQEGRAFGDSRSRRA